MKSLYTYINEGFFNNVGATLPGAKEWIEAYKNEGGILNCSQYSQIKIDKDNRAVIKSISMRRFLNLAIRDNSAARLLLPDGELPPKISLDPKGWERICLHLYKKCNLDEISLKGFPKNIKDILELDGGWGESPFKVRMTDDMKNGYCEFLSMINMIPVDPENIPYTSQLAICIPGNPTNIQEFKNALPGLMIKWGGWGELENFSISLFGVNKLTDDIKNIVINIDNFIKTNYPDLYKFKSYNDDTIFNIIKTPTNKGNLQLRFSKTMY